MRPQPSGSNAIGYEDFQPQSEWKTEEGANALLLRLPGFTTKEQIKSKYEKSNRIVQVFGESRISNIWRRFNQVFVLPEHINTDQYFYTSFENGIFKITFPKETVAQAPLPSKTAKEKEGKEKSVSFQTPPTEAAVPMAQKGQDETPPQVDSTKITENKETSEANEKPIESKMGKEDAKATNKDVEGQLLVKMFMFVIVAVGVYISYRFGASRKAK